ncbi:MAG: pilus assembly protein [Kouleothrix sp.]|nr:pilus assembly protein [Kouleothrix sp.]
MSQRCLPRRRLLFQNSRGQSLVETALLLPLLIVLLFGVVEFGFFLYAHVQVANAARESARAASLYNLTRYTSSGLDNNGDALCSGGWTLLQTAQQAVVYREAQTSGSNKNCPNPNGVIRYTSLGRLTSTVVFTVTVSPAQSTYTSPSFSPTPGTTGTVTLTYPYRLPILSNFLPILKDPVLIRKSVQYEYQQ